MMDRRRVVVSGMALVAGAGSPALAGSAAARRRSIDAITLPPSFNGILAYGRAGRIEHWRCVGMADIEAATPVTPLTRFKWGSASKWLVSTAALRLAEAGRLSLDAPITTYLPAFRRDTGDRVRVAHLLSNTSGIPDLLGRQLRATPSLRTSDATPAEMVARFAGGDLQFAPGQGWDYAALNWVIVAALLHRLTGEAVAPLVGRLVLDPLRMRNTGFAQADQPPMPALAAAYATIDPPIRKMLPIPSFLAASGNVAGTAADAVRAAHGIFHGSLLRPASRQRLATMHWPEQDYALGGRIRTIAGEPWAWETGKAEGYRAHIAHRLEHSETIVIFNSTDIDQTIIGSWVETIARA